MLIVVYEISVVESAWPHNPGKLHRQLILGTLLVFAHSVFWSRFLVSMGGTELVPRQIRESIEFHGYLDQFWLKGAVERKGPYLTVPHLFSFHQLLQWTEWGRGCKGSLGAAVPPVSSSFTATQHHFFHRPPMTTCMMAIHVIDLLVTHSLVTFKLHYNSTLYIGLLLKRT